MAEGRDDAYLGQHRCFIRVVQYSDRGDRREGEVRPDQLESGLREMLKERKKVSGPVVARM